MNEAQKRQLLSRASAAIIADPNLSDKEKIKAEKAVTDAVENFVVPNTKVYWIAVGSIAVIAIIIVLGTFWLQLGPKVKTPDFLMIKLGTAIGALAGMLVPAGK